MKRILVVRIYLILSIRRRSYHSSGEMSVLFGDYNRTMAATIISLLPALLPLAEQLIPQIVNLIRGANTLMPTQATGPKPGPAKKLMVVDALQSILNNLFKVQGNSTPAVDPNALGSLVEWVLMFLKTFGLEDADVSLPTVPAPAPATMVNGMAIPPGATPQPLAGGMLFFAAPPK